MSGPSPLDLSVLEQVRQIAEGGGSPRVRLEQMLRLLGKWRSQLLQNTVIHHCGLSVQSGPFAGMSFIDRSAEGCHIPKLLGCYEAELHGEVEAAIARGYESVLNIGCAEGYYAIGLARRMPQTQIFAYDIDPRAQETCRRLAEVNRVSERITIGGLFRGADFAAFADQYTLLICDIEGAETELLDPDAWPALRGIDILVELHELTGGQPTRLIGERFKDSHEIRMIPHGGRDVALPAFFAALGHLDQLLAVWEWRSGPTPWAMLRARQPNGRPA